MGYAKYDVKGFDVLQDQLEELMSTFSPYKVIRNGTFVSVRKALEPVLDGVKADAPYDVNNKSGIHLRETARINVRIPNESDKNSYFYHPGDAVWGMVSVKKSAVSLAQEFGTAKMNANPYLRGFFETNAKKVAESLRDNLKNQIFRVTKNPKRLK